LCFPLCIYVIETLIFMSLVWNIVKIRSRWHKN
jgi:uncharacterized membrane protein